MKNHYIVNLRVIRIGLNLLILSYQTKWRSRVRSVFVITLRNEKGPILHFLWHQWKSYRGTVNGQCWQCQSCSEYIQLLDIWIQLKKGASVNTIFINSHMLPFSSRSNLFRVWNIVSHSQIHQQHRENKNIWLVNNILIWRNKGWNFITLWDNNWCHMHKYIERNHI